MPGMPGLPSVPCQPEPVPVKPGVEIFPTHPYARSPRDFFMVDYEPGATPY
jgi:hypothetical protein